jgi:hypothetical protein
MWISHKGKCTRTRRLTRQQFPPRVLFCNLQLEALSAATRRAYRKWQRCKPSRRGEWVCGMHSKWDGDVMRRIGTDATHHTYIRSLDTFHLSRSSGFPFLLFSFYSFTLLLFYSFTLIDHGFNCRPQTPTCISIPSTPRWTLPLDSSHDPHSYHNHWHHPTIEIFGLL